jgi:glycosyltransferase involved in cell wall biosynthesis
MKLSVIVPVYNVEKFLPRCLESLLRQGMKPGEWEVICVNDGSPDNCGDILTEYEAKHPDVFKVIEQENAGVGSARNTGMKLAQGEWISFIDPDDYAVDGAYRYLLDHFCGDGEEGGIKRRLDLLCFGYHHVYTDGKTLYDPDARPDGEVSFEGDGVDAYNKEKFPYVWSKFYRKVFLDDIHISYEDVIYEDEMFNFEIFRHHPYTRVVTSNIVRYENNNAFSLMKTTDREVVLVQLNDLYYVMGVIRRYLAMDNPELAPASYRILSQLQESYYNKMIRTDLTYDDWKRYTKVLNVKRKSESLMGIKKGRAEKIVGMLKMMVVHSYVEYLFVRFLYRAIFRRFFLEKIYKS